MIVVVFECLQVTIKLAVQCNSVFHEKLFFAQVALFR